MFSWLLTIGQSLNVNLRDILTHSLAPVSLPLASVDGSLAKIVKSHLLASVEEKCADHLKVGIPVNTAIIVGAGPVIRSIKPVPLMFGGLADAIFDSLGTLGKKYKSPRIDFVCDRYPDVCIKNAERDRRAVGGCQTIQIYSKEQKTPKQWSKFLSSGQNKESSCFESWAEPIWTFLPSLAKHFPNPL